MAQTEIAKLIESYKNNRKLPPVVDYDKEYNVEKHKIFTNRYLFPDRYVEMDVYNPTTKEYDQQRKLVPLNRIGLPYQKKINSVATTFFCGIPVKYSNDADSPEDFVDSFTKVIDKNKTEFIDRKVVSSTGRYTECAELWYNVKGINQNIYGFDSTLTLKVKLLTPNEYKLYPIFDENDDLIRFSFSYSKTDNATGDKVEVFKSYTAEKIEFYEKKKNDGWVKTKDEENPIGKIPIVYYQQESVEWADVQTAIERLESIYSNTAESNDRFSYPILLIKGEVSGQLTQEKTGKVLELTGEGADASFVDNADANQSLKDEKETLEQDIHDFTNTPNISFDNMKGLGNILSGASAEFLFLSAHLKVKEKMSIYVPAFQRRVSIIASFLQNMNGKFLKENLVLTPIITPYVINNDMEFFKMLMEINGGQPIVSQKESMRRGGIKEPEKMIEEIQEESTARMEIENSNNPTTDEL